MRWCLGGRDGDGGASWVVDGRYWVVMATKVSCCGEQGVELVDYRG